MACRSWRGGIANRTFQRVIDLVSELSLADLMKCCRHRRRLYRTHRERFVRLVAELDAPNAAGVAMRIDEQRRKIRQSVLKKQCRPRQESHGATVRPFAPNSHVLVWNPRPGVFALVEIPVASQQRRCPCRKIAGAGAGD